MTISKLKQGVLVPAREWRVVVHTKMIGDIGSVVESGEDNARCAALHKFCGEGERKRSLDHAIFEDDDFDVRPT